MKLPRRNFLHLAAGAAALPAVSRIARAQAYPSRPVRIIAGFPPGGFTDTTARLIGQWLSERLGQQFFIENRPGASGNIAAEAVVRSPPDGYTLLVANDANAYNATLYDNLKFNFIHDITPVASIGRVAFVMVVNPSFAAKTVPEFIANAKGQSRQDQHGDARAGERITAFRSVVQSDGRCRSGHGELSRNRACVGRSVERPGRGRLHLYCLDN
jgi:tripartite-type tricarboxylate transporter receptor subunit TctC